MTEYYKILRNRSLRFKLSEAFSGPFNSALRRRASNLEGIRNKRLDSDPSPWAVPLTMLFRVRFSLHGADSSRLLASSAR